MRSTSFHAVHASCLAVLCLLAGCETFQPTAGASVEYNRSFARARDEVLVLNVLRSSERQPLQFSAISEVTGGLRTGVSVTLPFTNIIVGGQDEISPELGFNNRNPTVSIVPLSSKEFVQGLAKPLDPGMLNDLLAQGWPRALVMTLAVGGVVCPDDRVVSNKGDDLDLDRRFFGVFRQASGLNLGADDPVEIARFRLSDKDALTFIKDGVGSDRSIDEVRIVDGREGRQVELAVVRPGVARFEGLDVAPICASPSEPADRTAQAARSGLGFIGTQEDAGIVLRSILGIYEYLGRSQASRIRALIRDCETGAASAELRPLFNIRLACPGSDAPTYNAVSTEFLGRRYYVPTAGSARGDDLTLETLTLLNVLIELRTTESSLSTTTPVVTVAR